ncbi:MAG: hypothetical protein WDW38_003163 [Sanguina aurantia]
MVGHGAAASKLGSDLVIGGKVVLGAEGGATTDTWRELDEKVNKYPGQREFKAIGSGGSAFSAAMLAVIEQVVGPVQAECMTERPSSKGSYMSVTIGPVWVMRPEQVVEIYALMKADARLKWNRRSSGLASSLKPEIGQETVTLDDLGKERSSPSSPSSDLASSDAESSCPAAGGEGSIQRRDLGSQRRESQEVFMVQATDGNSLHQQGAATHTMLTLQLPRLPSEQLSAGLEFGQGADLSGAPWDSFWGTHEHLEAGPFHLGGAAPAWVTLNQSSTSTEQGGGRTASTPPPAAATQDDTGWWSHISSDAPHAGTNEAHTLLDTYPPARHTTSPPGRQAGLFGNPTVQLPASAAHLGHDPGAHHAHQPRQPSPPWLLQPAPDSMSPPCEPQPGREPGASRFQSHGSLSFRPGHRHMSDPGLDSPFTPGSRSTPGGRSASSASAGGAAQRHPHARGGAVSRC